MGGNYLGFVTEVFGRARDKRLCIVEHPIFVPDEQFSSVDYEIACLC